MKSNLSLNSLELLMGILNKDQKQMAQLLLKHTYFIHPEIAHKVVYPTFVRPSKAHHPGSREGSKSTWLGQEVSVVTNLKARDAFSVLSGEILNGKKNRPRTVSIGWEVAHIWGMVHDPKCFTAGWNMSLMPNFLRDLTEEQNNQIFFQQLIQQVSYELYFKNKAAPYEMIRDQGIDLSDYIPLKELNLLRTHKIIQLENDLLSA